MGLPVSPDRNLAKIRGVFEVIKSQRLFLLKRGGGAREIRTAGLATNASAQRGDAIGGAQSNQGLIGHGLTTMV